MQLRNADILELFKELGSDNKIFITSGLRSLNKNIRAYRNDLGAMIDSPHMTGNSVDIRTTERKDGSGKAGRALWKFFKTKTGGDFLKQHGVSAYYHDAGTGYHIDITTARPGRPAGKVYRKNRKTGKITVENPGYIPMSETEMKNAQTRLSKVNEYNNFIEKAAMQFDLPVDYLKAIMAVESGGKPEASSGSAFGLMQLTRDTWNSVKKKNPKLASYDFDTYWNNPEINTLFGAAALKSKAKSMNVEVGDPDFINLAVTAYNAGQGTVKFAIENAKNGGSQNPKKDFLLEKYMKPAIKETGIYSYYLTGKGKRRNKTKTIKEAIDLKYKEISKYGPKVNSYLGI